MVYVRMAGRTSSGIARNSVYQFGALGYDRLVLAGQREEQLDPLVEPGADASRRGPARRT